MTKPLTPEELDEIAQEMDDYENGRSASPDYGEVFDDMQRLVQTLRAAWQERDEYKLQYLELFTERWKKGDMYQNGLVDGRAAALEEATKVADGFTTRAATLRELRANIAAAIRALKEKK
jgi:hypothetical protein